MHTRRRIHYCNKKFFRGLRKVKKVVNAVDYESALVSARDAEDSRMFKHLQLLFLRKLPQRLQQSLRLMMYSVISVLPTHSSIVRLD